MRDFKGFLGKELVHDRVKDAKALEGFGIKVRYLPDPPDIFDEYEFGMDWHGRQDVAFLVAVEKGKIARMLFGRPDGENPDILRPMEEDDLLRFQEEKGEQLMAFFKYLISGRQQ